MSFLLVTIDRHVAYYITRPDSLSLCGAQLEDTGLGDWTGFYDWLRNCGGKVIGVRYWPFEQAEFLLKECSHCDSVRVDSRGALLFFFGGESGFEEKLSGDQAFEEARILKTKADQYALLFGCDNLTEAEQNALAIQFLQPKPGT